jgi:hypothetical protein
MSQFSNYDADKKENYEFDNEDYEFDNSDNSCFCDRIQNSECICILCGNKYREKYIKMFKDIFKLIKIWDICEIDNIDIINTISNIVNFNECNEQIADFNGYNEQDLDFVYYCHDNVIMIFDNLTKLDNNIIIETTHGKDIKDICEFKKFVCLALEIVDILKDFCPNLKYKIKKSEI